MKWFIGFIFISLLTSSATAQAAPIRAGEHARFTRLVITIPEGTEWDVGKMEGGFGLQVSGISDYETEAAFERIPKDRILDLIQTQAGGTLFIASECACYADAFLWQPDKLVVDIRDGAAPANSTFNDFLSTPSPSIGLPIITAQRPIVRSVPAIVPKERSDLAVLSALEQVVIEGIARGATQGLLKPSENISASITDIIDGHISQNQPGLYAHTSIDRLATSVALQADQICLPNSYFDLPSWGGEVSFHHHIAQLRGAVTGEFDRPDAVAIERLAEGFLYYGFGREARNVLMIDAGKSLRRTILIELAAIMDGNETSAVLKLQADCDSPVALWGMLASPDHKLESVNRSAVLRAFKALPFHLQTHLGPMLSGKFLLQDDFEAAEIALAVSLNGVEKTIEAAIANTDLHSAIGQTDRAVEALEILASSDNRMTPDALIDYFNLAIDTGSLIDPEAIALADIVRFEQRGNRIVGDLAEAQVGVLMATENVQGALDLISEEKNALGLERFSTLQTEALKLATARLTDMTFVEMAFGETIIDVDPSAQNIIAKRLLDLGFPERAGILVAGSSVGNAMINRRYLRAEAALARAEPEAALVHLIGLADIRAMALRRSAELVLGGEEDIALDQVASDWRLGNWATLSQGTDGLLQEISASILDEEIPAPDRTQPLAQGRDLLLQSTRTRELLDGVLERFAPVLD
ncbi:MAG: hypothetical protein ACJAXK_001645 [Yoonia sp.]|jgi:hypothetical protein